MTPLILDQTPASCAPRLKATLRELLAETPPEFLKGLRQVVFERAPGPQILQASGKVSSQYVQRDGAAVIHVYLDHVDRKAWRLVPLSWRPWTRARLLAEALSHALAMHRWRGKQQDPGLLRQEARRVQASLLRKWLARWIASQELTSALGKDLLHRVCEYRIRRISGE